MNRIGGTVLFTQMACNTSDVAYCHNILTLILIRAPNRFRSFIGNELDQMSGAGLDAGSAGLAGFLVNHGYSVYDMDRIKGTGTYT